MAVVTETWLKDLEEGAGLVWSGAGLCTLTLNRFLNPQSGIAHGAVAVITIKNLGNFKKIPVTNPDCYEVLPVIGSLSGYSRKIIIIIEPA